MNIDQQINKIFADLRWSILSERIFAQLGDSKVSKIDLEQADKQIADWRNSSIHQEQLRSSLNTTKSTRLGVYYEHLWRYFLNENSTTELLCHNLQVNDKGITRGEFDFIYYDRKTSRAVHMEAAVKFYLGVSLDNSDGWAEFGKSSQWCQWVGPGLKDRLDLKLNQMASKQLRLQFEPSARRTLTEHNISEGTLDTELQLAGRLFYPGNAIIEPPAQANIAHERGVWFSVADYIANLQNFEQALSHIVSET